jgi:hypothetical protein
MQNRTLARPEAEPERHTRLQRLARRYIVAAGLGLAVFSVVAPLGVHAASNGETRRNTNTQNCTNVNPSKDGVPASPKGGVPASGQDVFVIAFTTPFAEMPFVEMPDARVPVQTAGGSRNSKQDKQSKVTCKSSNVVVQKPDEKGH